jgi:ankyrin repeat protein
MNRNTLDACFIIARYLDLDGYIRLRAANRLLHRLLEVPTVSFASYQRSTVTFGDILRGRSRIRLDIHQACDETFIFLATNGHAEEFVRILNLKSSKISTQAKQTALSVIVELDHSPEMVEALVKDNSVDLNEHVYFVLERDGLNRASISGHANVLHWASLHGYLELMYLILQKELVDIRVKDQDGQNILHYAARGGQLETLRALVQDGRLHVEERTFEGWSMIHYVASCGHTHVYLYLVNVLKADPLCRTSFGFQPVHLAASDGQFEMLELLLSDPRVDPTAADLDWKQPLHYAVRFGHDRIISLLLNDPRIDPTAPDGEGRMLTHIAALHGNLSSLKLLTQDPRINPHTSTRLGVMPRGYAALCGHLDIVDYLEEHLRACEV